MPENSSWWARAMMERRAEPLLFKLKWLVIDLVSRSHIFRNDKPTLKKSMNRINSPVMSYSNYSIESFIMSNLHNMICHPFERIRIHLFRFVRVAVSKQVRSDDTVSALLQFRHDTTPVIAGTRKPMKQEKGRFICVCGGNADVGVRCPVR